MMLLLTGQDSTILDLSGEKAHILRQGAITREDIPRPSKWYKILTFRTLGPIFAKEGGDTL